MTLLTLYSAAKVKGAPSKPYLTKLSQNENRPPYFVMEDDVWRVNVEDQSWLELLMKRLDNIANGRAVNSKTDSSTREPKKKKQLKNIVIDDDIQLTGSQSKAIHKKIDSMTPINTGLDIADLKQLKLEAEVQEKNIKNEILYLNMQKQSGNIIDFDLAKYLFFSYMEKANIDFYRAARKNEAIIANFVKEGKVREIIQVVENECTAILKEIEKKQKEALDKWNEEEGRK